MAEKIKVLLEVDDNGTVRVVDQLNEKLDQTEKSAENAKKSTASLAQQLSTIKGPIGQVVQGFQGMGQAMKIMMANPLGIFLSVIAGLLYSLKRALSDSEEGQEKMNRVTSVFGALLGNLTDLVASLGEKLIDAFTNPMDALKSFANFFKDQIVNRIVGFFELIPKFAESINLLFSGEFAESGKVAADAMGKVVLGVEDVTEKVGEAIEATKEFAKEQEREAKLADKVAQMRNKAARLERQLMVDRSLLEQQIAEFRLKSRQEDQFSAEERKQAILDAQKLEEQLLAKEVQSLTLKRDAQKLENTFSRTNKENADKEAAAIAAVNQKIADRTNLQRGTQRELNRINREIEANSKAQLKEEEERLKAKAEADKKFLEDSLKNEEAFVNEQFDKQKLQALKEIENAEALAARLAEIETERTKNLIQVRSDAGQKTLDLEIKLAEETAKKKAEIDKQAFETKKKLDEAQKKQQEELYAAIGGALTSFSKLAGEQTMAGKALAIAATIMDTYMGATKALAAGAGTPVGYINAAAIVATGLANLRTITAVQVPNGGSAGATASTPMMPSGPSVGIIQGQMSQTSQLQAELNSQMRRPTRAYVVGQNVTTQQSLDRHILENATL
jgi:hypothetical protein